MVKSGNPICSIVYRILKGKGLHAYPEVGQTGRYIPDINCWFEFTGSVSAQRVACQKRRELGGKVQIRTTCPCTCLSALEDPFDRLIDIEEGPLTLNNLHQRLIILYKLTRGIELDDGPIVADKARLVQASGGQSIVEITLHSGRNRIVRRMLDEVGHPVTALVRRQFGPLHLGSLKSGATRDLTKIELGQVLTLARSKSERT